MHAMTADLALLTSMAEPIWINGSLPSDRWSSSPVSLHVDLATTALIKIFDVALPLASVTWSPGAD
jgi:hypothetical protein